LERAASSEGSGTFDRARAEINDLIEKKIRESGDKWPPTARRVAI